MNDDPVEPVRPIHPVRKIREIGIPRQPSFGQLQTWLRFSQRVARRAKTSQPATDDSGERPETHKGPGTWA